MSVCLDVRRPVMILWTDLPQILTFRDSVELHRNSIRQRLDFMLIQSYSSVSRAYTEINVGGGKICAKRKNFFCPPLGAPRGGQNSNCKFITLGFLDIRHKYKILKRHTYSPNNYLLSIVSKKSTFYYTFIGIFSI